MSTTRIRNIPAPSGAATADAFVHAVQVINKGARRRWWSRRGDHERGFWYADAQGQPIGEPDRLARIDSLALPPAWTEVRICPSPRGRLQAVGIDAAGRVQYVYHRSFVGRRQRAKFGRLVRFGEMLPAMRRRIADDLARPGLPKEKVLAVIVRLVADLCFRVGAERNVQRYRTYGITTLRNRHLKLLPDGAGASFAYVGKHHVRHCRQVDDGALVEALAELKAFGGSRLFNFCDEKGHCHAVTGRDVNGYVKETMGEEFSAKDFRTWNGTLEAARLLAERGPARTQREAARNVSDAVKTVAVTLGNTAAVCRASYIHPAVTQGYLAGRVAALPQSRSGDGGERALLEFLRGARA